MDNSTTHVHQNTPAEVFAVRGMLKEGCSAHDLERWRANYLNINITMTNGLQRSLMLEVIQQKPPSEDAMVLLEAVQGGYHAGVANNFMRTLAGLVAGTHSDQAAGWAMLIIDKHPMAAAFMATEGQYLRQIALTSGELPESGAWVPVWKRIWKAGAEFYMKEAVATRQTMRDDGLRVDGRLVGMAITAIMAGGKVRMNEALATRLKQDITTLMPLDWLPGSGIRVETLDHLVSQRLSACNRARLRHTAQQAGGARARHTSARAM